MGPAELSAETVRPRAVEMFPRLSAGNESGRREFECVLRGKRSDASEAAEDTKGGAEAREHDGTEPTNGAADADAATDAGAPGVALGEAAPAVIPTPIVPQFFIHTTTEAPTLAEAAAPTAPTAPSRRAESSSIDVVRPNPSEGLPQQTAKPIEISGEAVNTSDTPRVERTDKTVATARVDGAKVVGESTVDTTPVADGRVTGEGGRDDGESRVEGESATATRENAAVDVDIELENETPTQERRSEHDAVRATARREAPADAPRPVETKPTASAVAAQPVGETAADGTSAAERKVARSIRSRREGDASSRGARRPGVVGADPRGRLSGTIEAGGVARRSRGVVGAEGAISQAVKEKFEGVRVLRIDGDAPAVAVGKLLVEGAGGQETNTNGGSVGHERAGSSVAPSALTGNGGSFARAVSGATTEGTFQQILNAGSSSEGGSAAAAKVLNAAQWPGRYQMTMQLDPPSLGQMRVEVRMDHAVMTLRVNVESAGVGRLVESRLHELREALAAQGIRIDRAEVTVQTAAEPQPGSTSHHQREENESAFRWRNDDGSSQQGDDGGRSQEWGDASARRGEEWRERTFGWFAEGESDEDANQPVESSERRGHGRRGALDIVA